LAYTTDQISKRHVIQARFDSDSVPIRVDNCCSRTISGYIDDFDPTTLKEATNDMKITGFGNTVTNIKYTGTLTWHITDDDDVV
jgi:hypothetical protein